MSGYIVGFGEALVDVLPSGEVIGGAPLNFTIRAAEIGRQVGFETSLISRVGTDQRGSRIQQRLLQAGVDTTSVQRDSEYPTGHVDVSLQDGQPDYKIASNVAWDHIQADTAAEELAQTAAAFCFGSLAQRAATSAASLNQLLAVAEKAVKICDINLRRPFPRLEIINDCLEHAHVLKCNEQELFQLADWLKLANTEHAEEIAGLLNARFQLRCVFWTRGSKGCCWQSGGQLISGQVPQMPAAADADSVGAGDAATAALVVGLVAGWPPERIVDAANLCGAYANSRRGPTDPLPEDIMRRIVDS